MTFSIVRHTQFYLVVYSIWLVSRTGREKRLEQRQITTLARAVGLLVLSIIGILASPSLSLALEKYGFPCRRAVRLLHRRQRTTVLFQRKGQGW